MAYKVEHKGLEPEIDQSIPTDKVNKSKDYRISNQANSRTLTNIKEHQSAEVYGQIYDNTKDDKDKIRAQYKNNEIPEELIKLMKVWTEIPESMAKGILTMVEYYL